MLLTPSFTPLPPPPPLLTIINFNSIISIIVVIDVWLFECCSLHSWHSITNYSFFVISLNMSCLLLLVKFLSFEQENLNCIFLTKQDGYKQSFWNRLLSQQKSFLFSFEFFFMIIWELQAVDIAGLTISVNYCNCLAWARTERQYTSLTYSMRGRNGHIFWQK